MSQIKIKKITLFANLVSMGIDYRMNVYSEILKNLPEYLVDLKKDFEVNSEYADVFSYLFLNGYPIKRLIFEDKTITSLDAGILNKQLPYDRTKTFPLRRINQIPFNLKITNKTIFDDNFLSKENFETLNEANDRKSSVPYFLIDTVNFKKKLDKYFLKNFPDYKKGNKASIFEKKISNEFSLYFDTQTGQISRNKIEFYRLPLFTLSIKEGIPISFFSESDLQGLLFTSGGIFGYFYSHYVSYFTNDKGGIHSKTANDEPMTVHNILTGEYEVRNSEDLTLRVNKYIETSIELYSHYFRIFETWLIKVLNNVPPNSFRL